MLSKDAFVDEPRQAVEATPQRFACPILIRLRKLFVG